jgi:hypothetical protein
MIIFKKHTDTTPNGSTTLFQLPTEYVVDSVTVMEIKADKTVLMLDVNELGTTFIETTTIPEAGSSLLVLYSFNDESIELAATTLEGFKPWDSKRLIEIMESIVTINQTIENILKGFKNKVSKEEVSAIIGPLHDKVKVLELRI